LIASRFNSAVTERLLTGALEALRKHGVAEERIEIVHVPGAFEIPLATEMMAQAGRFDALVCLGAVVRGETPHFHYISRWVVSEIGRLSVAHRLPIALGVLTTDSMEQALQRSAPDRGNKGYEAALTAIEMANLRNAVGCKD
jgi:6,7-dimethyl-8-ribityllumazine synthase